MADTGPSRILVAVLVVVVIVAGIGAAFAVNYFIHPKSVAGPLVLRQGDNATVNYIGLLGSGPQEGKVFDTSLYSVYANNATWPKSLTYVPRTPGNWTPLPVHIGPTGSYTFGTLTFSTVVTGFWQGLIGAQGNQTRWISIPYPLGYGSQAPACFRTSPIQFTLPVLVTVAPGQFATVYPGENSTPGTTFADPTYGWNDLVLSVNTSAITVENLPRIGNSAAPYGFNISVTNVSATTITLQNDITFSNFGNILGKVHSAGLCGASQFIITSVDPAAGTFTEYWATNYLQQASETMIFVVTPVNIFPG